jgi:hypothetical protein
MKDFLDKLSSYNLFNYLLPGIVFVVLSEELTHYSLVQDDIVIGVFLYYFVGLVISRVGSLAIEPLLKRVSFLQFAEYEKFVTACKGDEKIELLSEVNNTYRTLISSFLLLLLLKVYEQVEGRVPVLEDWRAIVVAVPLTVMFLFAYRKQTSYITKRVRIQADQ